MDKADGRKATRPGGDQDRCAKTKRRKARPVVETASVSVGPEVVEIIIRIRTEDAVRYARSVKKDGGVLDAVKMLITDRLIELAIDRSDGCPKKYDDVELLERYEQFLASRRNPAHGVREFARRMGADTDKKVRAIAQAVRDARRRAAEN